MDREELNSKLLEAAEKGDTDRIWELVEQGADINARDQWGKTALIVSALWGHLTPELLDAFINNGADINARDEDGWTVLMYVALHGHLTLELFETLVSLGADVNARDAYGNTTLMWAAREGHLTPELLEAIVSSGADVNARNEDGRTAMSMLCTGYFNEQHVGSLLSFFSCGYSIRDMYDGWTPESFIKWLKDNKVKNEGRTVYALLAALSLYPERNETLDKYVSQKRSAAADVILYGLKNASHGMRENFLRMMSEGRAGALSLSDESVHVLAGMLLEAMDTNPGLAAEFIRKRVGKKVETWVKDGVEGANTLVSRLAHRMRQGEFVSEGAGMPDLDLF